MAHIFKHPAEGKGVIVFTHKEIGKVHSAANQLRQKYFLGIHYGSAANLYTSSQPWQDFCMGAKSTVSFGDDEPFRIPFNSRAFTPEYFKQDKSTPKYWDIINVSRNANVKKLHEFLKAIRKLYDKGKLYNVLLIVPSANNEKRVSHFTDIVEVYGKLFSEKEREHFTLMRLSKELGFLGISPRTIAHFYNSSKVFTLLSDAEGESRVIHEALLCGLPVVVFAGLLGGGRDYLNETNSVQFVNYNDTYLALEAAVEDQSRLNPRLKVDVARLSDELSERRTIPKLKDMFHKLYVANGEKFDNVLINTDNLNLRLPGHYLDVPWNTPDGNGITADILSDKQLDIFMDNLEL